MRRYLAMGGIAALLISGAASAACRLGQLVQLPVTMRDLRATIPVRINGTPAVFAVDSGSFFGFIAPAAAAQLHLRLEPALERLQISGIGGAMHYSIAHVDQFALGQLNLKDMDFVVGGNELGGDAQGLLGANVLNNADVDYDLANGALRLMRATDCKRVSLAYWDKGEPYSILDLEDEGPLSAPRGSAYLNGKKIRVIFDTGSPLSMLTLQAARRAGFSTTAPGVISGGYSYGMGGGVLPTWIGRFDSFKVGQEEIRNARLRVADIANIDFDMLIGADFFLAHHIYVGNSQHRLYFTYNGGPVFNLTPQSAPSGAMPRSAAPADAATPASSPTSAQSSSAAPSEASADAAELARQGAALAARTQYTEAIADLTRAISLDPHEAGYLDQRGLAEERFGQTSQAKADFDQALALQPDDITALLARAQLRIMTKDRAGASADALALDRALPKQADQRLALAALYMTLQQYPAAIDEYGVWLDAHRGDIAEPMMLNGRCRARALADVDLQAALRDCNASLHGLSAGPARANALDSRALLRIRLGDYAGAIKDYDASLSIRPRTAGSLYGRGIAEIHLGRAAAAAADLQTARALRANAGEVYRKLGIQP